MSPMELALNLIDLKNSLLHIRILKSLSISLLTQLKNHLYNRDELQLQKEIQAWEWVGNLFVYVANFWREYSVLYDVFGLR